MQVISSRLCVTHAFSLKNTEITTKKTGQKSAPFFIYIVMQKSLGKNSLELFLMTDFLDKRYDGYLNIHKLFQTLRK